MEIKFGNVPLTKASEVQQRMSMLLWGTAGSGKTSLAATAPGNKLLINFDPDGPASIASRDDVTVADFSGAPNSITERLKMENVEGLKKIITDGEFTTVIVDSLTAYMDKATKHIVTLLKGATVERPSQQGYGYRNAYLGQFVSNILRITKECNVHIIFIAHEDVPDKTEDGAIISIPIMLGGKLKEGIPLQISEVWAVEDTGKERRIAVRPCRMRKPMKTRMFDTSSGPEFKWNFDAMKMEGPGTIENFYNMWRDAGFKKIPLPK